jgi:hypothetical protein
MGRSEADGGSKHSINKLESRTMTAAGSFPETFAGLQNGFVSAAELFRHEPGLDPVPTKQRWRALRWR